MPFPRAFVGIAAGCALFAAAPAMAKAPDHPSVEGVPVDRFAIDGREVSFAELGLPRPAGVATFRFTAQGPAVAVPHCAGRGRVFVDGVLRDAGSVSPLVLALDPDGSPKTVTVEVLVSSYERHIACGEPPRVGPMTWQDRGLSLLRFPSPHEKFLPSGARAPDSGGEAVLFVPRRHDASKPGALLVGTHPWNGGPWTYAAYRELLEEAETLDVMLLMPNGLGNTLYTAPAEDEVMRALEVATQTVAIDPQRVSIWGASMGGAGATTISFHHPDRFAFVASYFGDSKYDLNTYVHALLPNDETARTVNALDVLENARHLPVWLLHGEADRTCPLAQSVMLYDAMKKAGFDVAFERVPGMGHEAALVVKYLRQVVAKAAAARAPAFPARVSFRSVRPVDTTAYGVRLGRRPGLDADAFVDLELRGGAVVVHAATGVSSITLLPGALGAPIDAPISFAPGIGRVDVRRAD